MIYNTRKMTTYLDILPNDIIYHIYMKKHKLDMINTFVHIKYFIKDRYLKHIKTNVNTFKPFIKLGLIDFKSNTTRRRIFINGNEFAYNKSVLLNYLKQNGKIGYKSWTFLKLYKKCISF